MVNLSHGDKFNLIEVEVNKIWKRLPTYDKVFLQAFIFKDEFNSCLQIVESNEVSEVAILKNGFNYDISSIVHVYFEGVYIQFGVVAQELSKNYGFMNSLQGFNFRDFHKCSRVVSLLGDASNIKLRTNIIFQDREFNTGVSPLPR